MIKLTILLAAICLGGVASPARADFAPVGERDAASNPVVAATASHLSKWLNSRGLHECATSVGQIHMADDLGDYVDESGATKRYGGATIGCSVWMLTSIVAAANEKVDAPIVDLCSVLGHEMAHTAGLSHEDMNASDFAWKLYKVCSRLGQKYMRDIRRASARKAKLRT